MVRAELVKRSPLRILEQSIRGGVGPGGIGVIASRKGVGKTACLVHIATDQLLQGRHVIHVSFSSRADHIVSWYEDIFGGLARLRSLERAMEIHDEIVRRRVIMNFNQDGVTGAQVARSLTALMDEGQFAADLVVVDGFDFGRGDTQTVADLSAFAGERGLTFWFSGTTRRDDPRTDANGVPIILSPYIEWITVLITLNPVGDRVKLNLVKDHDRYVSEDLHILLDPGSLLICE